MVSLNFQTEAERQKSFSWDRTSHFADYDSILAYYQAQSVLEHAHGGSLLDVGCGDCVLTELLCSKFTRVVGIDASRTHLEKARERDPPIILHESLLETFETEERFDTITMLQILEHAVDPIGTLKKAASFLKSNGTLIVHVPNALAINRRIARIMGTLADEYELSPYDIEVVGHRRSYDRKLLVSDMESAGFKIVSTGGIFLKMLSTAQMDWFLRNGLWVEGGFGWGRVGEEKEKDWKAEFCRACYEIGKEYPDDCNVIFACAQIIED